MGAGAGEDVLNTQEKHGMMITLGPGCYFLMMVWIEILGSKPADVGQLADATAISTPTIRKYLAKLRALGYVLPAGERWQLASNPLQLEFMGEDEQSGDVVPVIDAQAESVETVDKTAESVDKIDENGCSEKKNFFSPINIINKESLIKDSINNNSGEKNFFPDESENDDNQDTKQALIDCGIQINTRTRGLLRLDPSDIRREWLKLRDYGRQHETGLLITILEGVASKNERMGAGRDYASWES